jgi:hypothetical protein
MPAMLPNKECPQDSRRLNLTEEDTGATLTGTTGVEPAAAGSRGSEASPEEGDAGNADVAEEADAAAVVDVAEEADAAGVAEFDELAVVAGRTSGFTIIIPMLGDSGVS